MKEYEYKIYDNILGDSALEDEINILAKEGWRIIKITQRLVKQDKKYCVRIWLEREWKEK